MNRTGDVRRKKSEFLRPPIFRVFQHNRSTTVIHRVVIHCEPSSFTRSQRYFLGAAGEMGRAISTEAGVQTGT
jgi:hypothetical protein